MNLHLCDEHIRLRGRIREVAMLGPRIEYCLDADGEFVSPIVEGRDK